MFYELRATIFVTDRAHFDDIIDKLDDLKPQMHVVNPDRMDEEASRIDILENHHDVNPNEPCHLLEHWDNSPGSP